MANTVNHGKRLVRELSFASLGNIILQLGGIITFPVWTRIFSVEEYGLISLALLSVALLSSLSKFGLQHAATRYYSIFKKDAQDFSCFYTTILTACIFISTVFSVLAFVVIRYLEFSSFRYLAPLAVLCVSLLSFSGALRQLMSAIMFVEERAKTLAVAGIIIRYGQFVASYIFVVYILWRVAGFLVGQFLVESIVVIALTIPYFLKYKIQPSNFSFQFFSEALKYGLPLLAFELSKMLLSLGDRYLIDFFLGAKEVGLYSAAYNLCTYAVSFFSVTLQNVLSPVYFEIWETEGRKKTEEFLAKVMKYYIYGAIPILCFFVYLGEDIVTFLASEKYSNSYVIMPFVMPALVLNGLYFILGAGLYVKKRSFSLFKLIFLSVILNSVLNILLIPPMGIRGAALATLFSYLLFIITIYLKSRKTLTIMVRASIVFRGLLAGISLLASVYGVKYFNYHLIFQLVAGGSVYLGVLILLDRDLARLMNKVLFLKLKSTR